MASTMASLLWINRLKKVDFPTLGLPTMATIALIHLDFGAKVVLFNRPKSITKIKKEKFVADEVRIEIG